MINDIRKLEAIRLRKKGYSLNKIAEKLHLSKSTLSGWVSNISLTKKQKEKLLNDWRQGLVKARVKAVIWHNTQKQNRLKEAKTQAQHILDQVDVTDINTLELALSVLYLGEGFKRVEETGMGNTDPLILKTFLWMLKKNYGIKDDNIRCQLNLRADQNSEKEKKYWAEELNLSTKNFSFIYLDKRTKGSKTHEGYHGVCSIRCGNVAIKRKLVNLGRMFCEKVLRA